MKRLLFCCFTCWLFSPTWLSSAINLNTDSSYCIVNGYSSFTNICLQSNQTTENTTNFKYTFAKREPGNTAQEWQLIPVTGDTSSFYIRNVQTHYYINALPQSGGSYYYTSPIISKLYAQPWTITELTNGQVLISCLDSYDIRYYMHATDTTSGTMPPFRSIRLSQNSRFAWNIILAGDSLINGITNVIYGNNIKVTTLDNQIIVTGTDNYRVFDLQGINITSQKYFAKGIYLVATKEKTFKVSIK